MTNNEEIILNGPLNYFKIYNKKNNQTLWIFMDYHESIYKQKKCEDYNSKDIDKYFYKIMSESDENLDFFLEIKPTKINTDEKYHYNDNYIHEIMKTFKKIYKELKNNSITNKKNIRLHYIDIRDYAFFYELDIIIDSLYKNLNDLTNNNLLISLHKIIGILKFINEVIIKVKKIKKIKKTDKNSIEEKILINKDLDLVNIDTNNNDLLNLGFIQIIKKILLIKKDTSLKNTKINLKEKLINFFNKNYIEYSKEVIKKLEQLFLHINKISKIIEIKKIESNLYIDKNILNKNTNLTSFSPGYGISSKEYNYFYRLIYDELASIEDAITTLGVVLTDSFFLTRLIENNNIKKSIIYTGAYHSTIYLWFLIKYADFQIIKYNYINTDLLDKKNPINSLENVIKKSNNYYEIFNYILPSKFNQCVKISKI